MSCKTIVVNLNEEAPPGPSQLLTFLVLVPALISTFVSAVYSEGLRRQVADRQARLAGLEAEIRRLEPSLDALRECRVRIALLESP